MLNNCFLAIMSSLFLSLFNLGNNVLSWIFSVIFIIVTVLCLLKITLYASLILYHIIKRLINGIKSLINEVKLDKKANLIAPKALEVLDKLNELF